MTDKLKAAREAVAAMDAAGAAMDATYRKGSTQTDKFRLAELMAKHACIAYVRTLDDAEAVAAMDGFVWLRCQVAMTGQWKDWLFIPHVDGQFVSAAKLQPFSIGIINHYLAANHE